MEPGVTVRGIVGHTAPLTGRDEELQLLREAARRARTERKAILFTILGLPGVGKSRLVRELGEELRTDDWHLLRGRCLPYGEGITYWPLGEIVRGLSGVTAELSSAAALERIQRPRPTTRPPSAWPSPSVWCPPRRSAGSRWTATSRSPSGAS